METQCSIVVQFLPRSQTFYLFGEKMFHDFFIPHFGEPDVTAQEKDVIV